MTMGALALARAVKRLAFAFGGLAKEDRFASVAPCVVVPRVTQLQRRDPYNGGENVTRLLLLSTAKAAGS